MWLAIPAVTPSCLHTGLLVAQESLLICHCKLGVCSAWVTSARGIVISEVSSTLTFESVSMCVSVCHFAGHSLVACPFADNSFPHVYLRLLAHLLPPSTRQPGPVAVLLGKTLKLTLIFSPISHSLGVDREMSSSCFSWVFLCIFYDRNVKFQVILFCCTGAMAIISVILTDRKQHNTWKRQRRKMCSVSVFFIDWKKLMN